MNKEKLRKDLDELKTEIENLESQDEHAAGRLRALAGSIEKTLEAPDTQQNEDLIDGIQGNIENFEADHPTITGILDRITKALSSMGI